MCFIFAFIFGKLKKNVCKDAMNTVKDNFRFGLLELHMHPNRPFLNFCFICWLKVAAVCHISNIIGI